MKRSGGSDPLIMSVLTSFASVSEVASILNTIKLSFGTMVVGFRTAAMTV